MGVAWGVAPGHQPQRNQECAALQRQFGTGSVTHAKRMSQSWAVCPSLGIHQDQCCMAGVEDLGQGTPAELPPGTSLPTQEMLPHLKGLLQ